MIALGGHRSNRQGDYRRSLRVEGFWSCTDSRPWKPTIQRAIAAAPVPSSDGAPAEQLLP